jgi:hypothetical protein
MGDKLVPLTEMQDFELPDEGVNVFVLQNPVVVKERKNRETGEAKPGWEYKIMCRQEGGGADGSAHFESFFTESKKNFSLNRLFGFLVKVGIYKQDADIDSDMFKTESFAKKWGLLEGKKIGLELEHKAWGNDKKVKSVAKKFLTPGEAKDAMKGKGTVAVGEEKKAVAADEDWGS